MDSAASNVGSSTPRCNETPESLAATVERPWAVEFVCGHRWSSEWHPNMDEPTRCPVCGESEIAYAEAVR